MTKMKKPSARELPLVKRRIAALLDKTEANGCTRGEAGAAIAKARELVRQYRLNPGAFRWPEKPSAAETEPTSEPSGSKPSPTTSYLSLELHQARMHPSQRQTLSDPTLPMARFAAFQSLIASCFAHYFGRVPNSLMPIQN